MKNLDIQMGTEGNLLYKNIFQISFSLLHLSSFITHWEVMAEADMKEEAAEKLTGGGGTKEDVQGDKMEVGKERI